MKAFTRFPLIPLPWSLRADAMEHEIVMNYETGDLYITKPDSQGATGDDRFSNISDAVAEQLRQDGSPADKMTITIPSTEPGGASVDIPLGETIINLLDSIIKKPDIIIDESNPPRGGTIPFIDENGNLRDTGLKPDEVGTVEIGKPTISNISVGPTALTKRTSHAAIYLQNSNRHLIVGGFGPTKYATTNKTTMEILENNIFHASSATIGFGGLDGFSMAGSDNDVLAVGGTNAQLYNGETWTMSLSLSLNVSFLGLVGITSNNVISIGGWQGLKARSVSDVYKFNGSSWSSIGNINITRCGLGASGLPSAAYIFGGSSRSDLRDDAFASTENFDGTTWSMGSNMIHSTAMFAGRGSSKSSIAGNNQNPELHSYSAIQYYESKISTWKVIGDTLTNRTFSKVSGDDRINVFSCGQDPLDDTALFNSTEIHEYVQGNAGLLSPEMAEKLQGIEEGATRYIHPTTHPAAMIEQTDDLQFVTKAQKTSFADKYTKSEVDNLFSSHEMNVDWKESVATFADIATTYPSPKDGWTVNVNDTNITYRYDGSKWIAISANSIPKATESLDGLMTKEAVKELNRISATFDNKMNKLDPGAAGKILVSDSAGNIGNLDIYIDDTIAYDGSKVSVKAVSYASPPNNVSDHAMFGDNDSFAVIGGYNTVTSTNSNKMYIFDSTTISEGANLPVALSDTRAVGKINSAMTAGGSILVGSEYTEQNTTYKFNGTAWSTGQNMIKAVDSHDIVGTPTAAYSVGRYKFHREDTGSQVNMWVDVSDDTEYYDGITWMQGQKLPYKVGNLSATGIVNNFVVFGGIEASENPSNTCIFNSNTWKISSKMITSVTSHCSSGIVANAFSYGGSNTRVSGDVLDSIQNFNSSIWKVVGILPGPRYAADAISASSSTAIMAGGIDLASPEQTVHVFKITMAPISINEAIGSVTQDINNKLEESLGNPSSKWVSSQEMNITRAYHAGTGTDNSMIVIGGFIKRDMTGSSDSSFAKEVPEKFNGNTWISMPAIPFSWNTHWQGHYALGNINNLISGGGYYADLNVDFLDSIPSKSPRYSSSIIVHYNGDTWSHGSYNGISTQVTNHCAVWQGDVTGVSSYFMISGGTQSGSEVTPESGQASFIFPNKLFNTGLFSMYGFSLIYADMISVRAHHKMVGKVNDAMVIGGMHYEIGSGGLYQIIGTIEKFNGDAWYNDSTTISSRFGFCASGTSNCAIISGGRDSSRTVNSTEIYDGISWKSDIDQIGSNKYARACSDSTSINMMMTGGYNGGGVLYKNTEKYVKSSLFAIPDLLNKATIRERSKENIDINEIYNKFLYNIDTTRVAANGLIKSSYSVIPAASTTVISSINIMGGCARGSYSGDVTSTIYKHTQRFNCNTQLLNILTYEFNVPRMDFAGGTNIVAGSSVNDTCDTTELFSASVWTASSKLLTGRKGAGSNKISTSATFDFAVVGGISKTNTILTDGEKFNYTTSTWSSMGTIINYPRTKFATSGVFNQYYKNILRVCNGFDSNSNATYYCEEIDISTNTSKTILDCIIKTAGSDISIMSDNSIMILSGTSDNTNGSGGTAAGRLIYNRFTWFMSSSPVSAAYARSAVSKTNLLEYDTEYIYLGNFSNAANNMNLGKLTRLIDNAPFNLSGIILSVDGWILDSTTNKYMYKIENARILSTRVVNVNFDLASQEYASFFGVNSVSESFNGYVAIYADIKPTVEMTVGINVI